MIIRESDRAGEAFVAGNAHALDSCPGIVVPAAKVIGAEVAVAGGIVTMTEAITNQNGIRRDIGILHGAREGVSAGVGGLDEGGSVP